MRGLVAFAVLVTGTLAAPAYGTARFDLSLGFVSGSYGTPERTEMSVAAVGVEAGDRLRLRLEVPLLRGQTSRTVIRTRLGEHRGQSVRVEETVRRQEQGLGDLRLRAAGVLAGGGPARHRLEGQLDLKAPTADRERHLGTGEWDSRLGLDLEYELLRATLFGGAGYNFLGDPPGRDLADVPDLYLGAESEPGRFGIRFAVWTSASGPVVPGAGWRWSLAVATGSSGPVGWRLVGRVGLTDTAEDFALEAGVFLHPRPLRERGR